MKFIHLADLHIGKRVHEFSMLSEQEHILEQILNYVKQYEPDGVLIAGDVYDRSVPGAEAVHLFDYFLAALHKAGVNVFLISGNHDSAERLKFAGDILEESNVYVAGGYEGNLKQITLQDEYGEVVVWLLPFVKMAEVRAELENKKSNLNAEQVISHLPMRRVLSGDKGMHADVDEKIECDAQAIETVLKRHFYTELETGKFAENTRHVLVAHQFVTHNGEAEQCESEYHSIGGVEEIDVSLFQAFDYVALGHLHGAQKIGRETVRYAGSPLKYSFSEVHQKKSITFVELKEKGTVQITLLPLTPLHDMRKIKGPLAALLSKEVVEAAPADDYIHVTLTDEEELYDAVGQLREKYPNLMRLEFDNSRTKALQSLDGMSAQWKDASPFQLFAEFYEQQNGVAMSEDEAVLLKQFLTESNKSPSGGCGKH